jgi:transposase
LFNEAELLDDQHRHQQDDSDTVQVPPHTRKRKRPRAYPDDIPAVDVVHDLADDEKSCQACGETLNRIGEQITTQLGVIPLQYFLIRHIRYKYACDCKSCIKTAPMPASPLPGTQASAQLISYLAVSKYDHGLPLYRQEKIAAREGIDLPRSKQARWLIQATSLLQIIYNLLQDALFSYDITLSDDTGIQVLKENGRRADNKSYLWIRRGGPADKPVVLVDYAPSKSGETAYGLLSQCHGYLVCDAAGNFNQSIARNALTPVLCNDHARRKFTDAIKGLDKKLRTKAWVANKAIDYYKALYRIERAVANDTDTVRAQRRQEKAVPIWDAFIKWATKVQQSGVVDDKTRDALNYLLKHEIGLREYCKDGRLPISNIKSEHVAKTIAIARKNFMFADTPAGAKSSAMLFSMIETAKANNHNPHHYLSLLLTALPNASCVEEVEALLPWNLTPEQASERYQALPKP